MIKKYAPLLLWIGAFELISFTIGSLTQGSVDGWYIQLARPPLVPPNIVFPIMWTILYALIAATGWHLWRAREAQPHLLRLFFAYMALNWSWSFVFFGAHLLLPGLVWILALNLIAVILIFQAWDRLRNAALLMIPPTLWTFFAAYLNAGYWWLNG